MTDLITLTPLNTGTGATRADRSSATDTSGRVIRITCQGMTGSSLLNNISMISMRGLVGGGCRACDLSGVRNCMNN